MTRLQSCAAFAAVLAGCGSSEPSSPADPIWISFHETTIDAERNISQERYLMVRPDGRYESAALNDHTARAGTLAKAQIEELQGLVSEGQFDIYVEESADCEAPNVDVALTTVAWRQDEEGVVRGREGCWVRSNVERAETQEFLDTISNMQLALVAE